QELLLREGISKERTSTRRKSLDQSLSTGGSGSDNIVLPEGTNFLLLDAKIFEDINDPHSIVQLIKKYKEIGFLYVIHMVSRSSIHFSPYKLKIVAYDKIIKDDFFTISSHGVTHYWEKEVTFTDLNRWEKDYKLYRQLLTKTTFGKFRQWKAFKVWYKTVRFVITKVRIGYLESQLFILQTHTRTALLEINRMKANLNLETLINISDGCQFTLSLLFKMQMQTMNDLRDELNKFRILAKGIVLKACRDTLLQAGFVPDDCVLDYPELAANADKTTYAEQANKRNYCNKLTRFIRIVDYFIITFKFQIVRNSCAYLLSIMKMQLQRYYQSLNPLPENEEEEQDPLKLLSVDLADKKLNQFKAKEITALFSITLLLQDRKLVFEPNAVTFVDTLMSIMALRQEVMRWIPNLTPDAQFESFTRPMINWKVEEKTCGLGPNIAFEKVTEAFQLASDYSNSMEYIKDFYLENEMLDVQSLNSPVYGKSKFGIQGVEFFQKTLNKHLQEEIIVEAIPNLKNLGLLVIDLASFRSLVYPSPTACLTALRDIIPVIGRGRMDSLYLELQTAQSKMERRAITTQENVEHIMFVDHFTQRTLPPTIMTVRMIVDNRADQRQLYIDRFCKSVDKDIANMDLELISIKAECENPKLLELETDRDFIDKALGDLEKKLNEFTKTAETFRKYQKHFDVGPMSSEQNKKFIVFETVSVEFAGRLGQSSYTVDGNGNDHRPAKSQLTTKTLGKIEQALNVSFAERPLTLSLLKELAQTDEIKEQLTKISLAATAEYGLEMLLRKMEDSWKGTEFTLTAHRDSRDVFILAPTDDIQQLLDESITNVGVILGSRNCAPVKSRTEEWDARLKLFNKTLEAWWKVQRMWLYLESIFSAPDIQRQLSVEAKIFLQVDKIWKDIMRKTNKLPVAMLAAIQPGMLESFQNCISLLDQVMKCLDAYLESKCMIFSRFFFLSNDELLEILTQGRNPLAVQPHLRKCFDGIIGLEFNYEESESGALVATNEILQMFSAENEHVNMTKGLKARGNVEDWLQRVEESMRQSVKKAIRMALSDYGEKAFEIWVVSGHCSQSVLSIAGAMWAAQVERILTLPDDSTLLAMVEFEKKCFENLAKLSFLVRGYLEPLQRSTLGALITLDVHSRDIITDLVQENVYSNTDFKWLRQLRYYWDFEMDALFCRMSNNVFQYGYEYLGASPRLVVTPLTDRHYLCSIGAMTLNLGAAPAGPAGTGKTETTKDLSKAMANSCVVFNCSDGMDYLMMGRFFKGIIQTGAWACFDEFNRIELEVLSVVAQQLITVRLAKMNRVSRFMFEGVEIRLNTTCNSFITMNPGYAGRTELPDNLKALFRPISMMVPNYMLIAEVIFYSEGFTDSKNLARKMAHMYQLCGEQLSKQDHYDFGMRAVKSVLVMAGALKRENPDKTEAYILAQSLFDSNLPKFLSMDAKIFTALMKDLFPSVDILAQEYGMLETAILKAINTKKLQPHPAFIKKVIQYYDTTVVRHGIMLVGPPAAGKTSCYEILQDALTWLHNQGIKHPHYKPVHVLVLNPKSVSVSELYGEFNRSTGDWHDGLLGYYFRLNVQANDKDHRWIVCDGPVDSVWIENLNSVLDDNKLLCLTNSERILLTPQIRCLYEVQDLMQATPATVSRCGMVYLDPNETRWEPYVESWLNRISIADNEHLINYIWDLFDIYLDDCIKFVNKYCLQIIPQVELCRVITMCNLMESILFVTTEMDMTLEFQKICTVLSQGFVLSLVWSFGGNLVEDSKESFELFVRQLFEDNPDAKLPSEQSLWGLFIDFDKKRLDVWDKIIPHFQFDVQMPFYNILVPTVDTVRFGYILEKLLAVKMPVLYTGISGVGKSVIARYHLSLIKDKSNYVPVFINFSAQTSSNVTQDLIEAKLVKKKKSMLGAPIGKRVIIFLDDVNMPKLDDYGSQAPLELLRQFLDFKGFYDRDKLTWKQISDVTLSAACAPPGGARNPLPGRFVRHFGVFSIPEPSDVRVKQIYKAIMNGFFYFHPFSNRVKSKIDLIVNSAVEVYMRMKDDLLPTPDKSHYIFNLRDLSKCFEGITSASPTTIRDGPGVYKLFIHEAQRVFHDRLINMDDKMVFHDVICKMYELGFSIQLTPQSFVDEPLIFADFLKMGVDRPDRVYEQVTSLEKLTTVLKEYIFDYNLTNPKEMNLVFFVDAMLHITRIVRILRRPRGNMLLVGVGGTGKQSLTRLATFISSCQFFTIELKRGYDHQSFFDDLKKLNYMSAVKANDTVFMITDTQIVMEDFVEDINNLLNSGEVPGMYASEDIEAVMIAIRPLAKDAGLNEGNREVVYNFFLNRCRTYIHMLLCMSPIGDSLRSRCRMFPSLINECTIDWFLKWPDDALLNVAKNTFKTIDFGENTEELRGAIPSMCVTVHQSVTEISERFYTALRRRYYTTPTSYLELLNLFTNLLASKKQRLNDELSKVEIGLVKLKETSEVVIEMQLQLNELAPDLETKSQATEEIMLKLIEEQEAADLLLQIVKEDEAMAKVKAEETQLYAEETQRILDGALPRLQQALDSLDSLDKSDIAEVRVFLSPPELVTFVMEAVCVLLNEEVEIANKELELVVKILEAKQERLTKVEEDIAELQVKYNQSHEEKEEVAYLIDQVASRLQRASKLNTGLANEHMRWHATAKRLRAELSHVVGDVFVATACIAYYGAFTTEYRQELVPFWVSYTKSVNVPISDDFSLVSVMADPIEIRQWQMDGLPKDSLSTENAILVKRARRWPLLIDPQDQGNRWIRNMETRNGMILLKFADSNFLKQLEYALEMGLPVLLEDVGEVLEPVLEPVLLKETIKQGHVRFMRLGEKLVPFDEGFKLYMTTKLSNPHYLPEIAIKVTIINFTVTVRGLEDQLLSDCVQIERPDLEVTRQELIVRINNDQKLLNQIEDTILRLLFSSEGNILDNEALLKTLDDSKTTSAEIGGRLLEAEKTEQMITTAREQYRAIAARGSIMYFVIASLADLDPMYQNSLKYFNQLFNQCIESSADSTDSSSLEGHIHELTQKITLTTYLNIARGLYEKHRLVYLMLLCADIMIYGKQISREEWNLFLRGIPNIQINVPPKPQITWLTEAAWELCFHLEYFIPALAGLHEELISSPITIVIGGFKIFLNPRKWDGYSASDISKRNVWAHKLNGIQRLILIKAFHEDKVTTAITEFVAFYMGRQFVESPPTDLPTLFEDLSKSTPLIFLLVQGSDPTESFMRFAKERRVQDRVFGVSLGQGQGPIAEKRINSAFLNGDWVYLQNCHVLSKWMIKLENIIKNMIEDPRPLHPNFRLFLSSMPLKGFPVSILQCAVKVTVEPPKGLRANLKGAMLNIPTTFIEDHIMQLHWRRMVFSLMFYHAILQERKKFGPLGWNVKYEFNDSDRECVLLTMELFCRNGDMYWDALIYTIHSIIYGGRITDTWDQRTLITILKTFFCPEALEKTYKFSPSGVYYAPSVITHEEYVNYIDNLPIIDDPEVFGLHDNANLSYQISETRILLGTLLSVQPQISEGAGVSPQDIVAEMANNMMGKLCTTIDVDRGLKSLFVMDSLNRQKPTSVVLLQEIERFNKFIVYIQDITKKLQKAVKGIILMDHKLEEIFNSMLSNQIPQYYNKYGYPSLKTFGSWLKDLILRIEFIEEWLTTGDPVSYWISSFFFPQAFNTAILQAHARKYNLPIDELVFENTILPTVILQQDLSYSMDQKIRNNMLDVLSTIIIPDEGALIHGLFLDAARFDVKRMRLVDSLPREMQSPLPVAHLLPRLTSEYLEDTKDYPAPVYKTSVRFGTLSTTGHSTNYVMIVHIPTKQPPDFWIIRGTALLTQITD
uniref:AAA+ ATPase domain-containing protein n=1 Tax=Strigamia maritima TaxID=126957 RepID=T1J4J2_STRMM